MDTPNFLIVTTDQQRWDAAGYCNPAIRTPNLDALAARGIIFERGYTTNPVCTPARCSILTGHYPSRHGCYMVGNNLPEDYPTIPAIFAGHGYFTGLLGKAHFKACLDPDGFESEPFIHNVEFFRDWDGPYYGFEWARLVIGHSTERHACGMHYEVWLRDRGVDPSKHFGLYGYHDYGSWDLPEEFHQSKWVADETIKAVDMALDEDRPFLLWASFPDPHNPCYVPRPWSGMYDPADMPPYGLTEGEMDDKPPFYRAMIEDRGYGDDPEIEQNDAGALSFMDERRTRERTALYYGMISLMDHHLGRIARHLEAKGLMDSTVIVFTSDHGEYTGNHGIWGKGLPAYEDAQRVPFVVCHPACQAPGSRSAALQSLVDIGPTMLSMAGLPVPAGIQGVDQGRAWADPDARVRYWATVEFRPCDGPFKQVTFIEERHKLVVYHDRPYGELYDLQDDPDQYRNLWDSPDHAALKLELLQRLISAEMEKDGVLSPRTAIA